RTSIAKPNQNQANRSFSTKMRVGSNRRLASWGRASPLTAVCLSSVCEVIRTPLFFRPARCCRVQFEGAVIVAEGGFHPLNTLFGFMPLTVVTVGHSAVVIADYYNREAAADDDHPELSLERIDSNV